MILLAWTHLWLQSPSNLRSHGFNKHLLKDGDVGLAFIYWLKPFPGKAAIPRFWGGFIKGQGKPIGNLTPPSLLWRVGDLVDRIDPTKSQHISPIGIDANHLHSTSEVHVIRSPFR